MHIAENSTVAKSLPPLRWNTHKSLILSYSADFSVILSKKLPMHPKTGGKGRINDIAIRYVAKLSGKGVSYGATSEAITKSTITAIILLILRSFQKKVVQ